MKKQAIVSIEKAKLEDVQVIGKLFNDYRIFYQQPSDLKLAQAFLTARLEKQDSVILVAKNRANDTLGLCQLYPSFSSISAQATWILNDLFVIQSARQQGIATQLLERAKVFAQQTQAKGISLVTGKSNFHAQNLYQTLGYQQQKFLSYYLPLL
ncbi:GNAT family N-acetyltransferase [Paraglaciecola aquimarina]|uniref:GNAT family N-acetyltransferase n=1 Tax=Paraglaciecola aquimarina TaxID=1235557 RepID=A0ABU3SWS5_9ALTE|nr:GNAT family N-acetyltransferase [Paraglaciecola aquimarina]MDU0354459.1 GNAT family N-acetyltransferase [Paraglaciecola aquimarina]